SDQIKQIIDHYGVDLKLDADSFVCTFCDGSQISDKPKFYKVVFTGSMSKKLFTEMINMNFENEVLTGRNSALTGPPTIFKTAHVTPVLKKGITTVHLAIHYARLKQ
uniref:Uncharacterized protein n=1 Tax=Romanomermis culicivorax TaxID=13658 RepID=A0A915HQN2_ROMCU